MEIGRLPGNPAQELLNRLVFYQRLTVFADPRQLGIGEVGMDRLVADRMDGDREAPLLRLGNRVMVLDPRADGPLAKPAGGPALAQPFFSDAFFFFIVS
ncbi:MAG: hypothetical protein HKO08_13320 [Erythrobacter sp.]|nr:hypothetical protein [Erythrobacter sp.]